MSATPAKMSLADGPFVTIKGKKNWNVMVISAYRVCNNSLATTGPCTCWKQQWRQLRTRGYKEPDP
eukprot:15321558-Ditylum_brightwellii.AAC.1